jgi:hypothetical protein
MTKATKTLLTAVDRAIAANTGSRAISVVPAVKDGHPVAEITFAKDEAVKTVSEPLD